MSVPLTVNAGSSQHVPEVNKPTSAASSLRVDDLLAQLQNAISTGDEEQAQTLALRLAKQKTKLSISPEATHQEDRAVR